MPATASRPRAGSARRARACAIPVALSAVVALAALAGCTVSGPDFHPPATSAPAHWSDRHGGSPTLAAARAAESPLPADRWAVFGDPELIRLQARARGANDEVRKAALRLLQARVQTTIVASQRGVQAAAQGGVSRQRQSEYGSASRMVSTIAGPNAKPLLAALSSPFTLYQAGFDASWEPDLWGRVLRSEEAAQASADEQRAALRQVLLGVDAEIARSYFALRAAQRQQRLVRDEIAAARDVERLLAAQRDEGLADESALNRQRMQLAGLRALLPALLDQEAQATNRITLLCGAQPGDLNAELAARDGDARPFSPPDLRLGLPSDLVRRRPDVAAAEARLHAATAGIGIAIADLYPRITLGAGFGLESVGAGRFGDWGSRQWTIGPSLSLPIFDHGRRRSNVVLHELQQQEAAVAFQQAVLGAWHEVDDALSGYAAEVRRHDELSVRLRRGEDEAGLARGRYAAGLTDYLPVLGAELTVLAARRDLAQSDAALRTALVAVYKSLGADAAASGKSSPPGLPGRPPAS